MVNLPAKAKSEKLAAVRGMQPSDIVRNIEPGTISRLLVVCLAMLPTLLVVVYFGFLASDRYVAETRFVVRTGSKPTFGGGLNSLLQMTGISRAQDDTFSVQQFILSRDVIRKMPKNVSLTKIYGHKSADYLARYPNFFYEDNVEGLHSYLKSRFSMRYNPNTSITTLKVQAFTPGDAKKLALALLDLSEKVINRINDRIRDDSMRVAREEVNAAQAEVVAKQLDMTNFRNRELMISPKANSILLMELIGKLSAELSRVKALIDETRAGQPQNPQIRPLMRRVIALEKQIKIERAKLGTGADGLAPKISEFERLSLEREFAAKRLASAMTAMTTARTEAMRQQLYLVRVVEPALPESAIAPERLYNIMMTLAANLIVLLIVWLLQIGITSHGFAGVNSVKEDD